MTLAESETIICSLCHSEKPVAAFYTCKTSPSGRLGRCKACLREYGKEYIRRWRQKHPARAKETHRRWRRRNAEYLASRAQRHRLEQPERYRATRAVLVAVRTGELLRPTRCSVCEGENGRVEGHHLSYEPHCYLAVFWMCNTCHKVAHSLNGH